MEIRYKGVDFRPLLASPQFSSITSPLGECLRTDTAHTQFLIDVRENVFHKIL